MRGTALLYDRQCFLAWYFNPQLVGFTNIYRFVLAFVIRNSKNIYSGNLVFENAGRIEYAKLVDCSADARKTSIADPGHESSSVHIRLCRM